MPQTISCEHCKAVLNLPAEVAPGKRLKCPKCDHRFIVTPRDANSASTRPGEADAANTSTYNASKSNLPYLDDLPTPRAEGDLREAFDLPLLASDAEKSIGSGGGATRTAVSDAAALFQDDGARRRRPKGAEARSQARNCVRCKARVPQGMSLCPSCGTDQETGSFVGLDDDLIPAPPKRPEGLPLHIAIPGAFCAAAGLVMTLLSLIQSVRVEPGVYQYGWLMLGVVAGYGVYGAVQFLRGKSFKVLILALTLGAIVNVIAMIGLPILEANFSDQGDLVVHTTATAEDPNDADLAAYAYKPVIDRLDQDRIKLGVALLIGYALFAVYLNSQPVRKFFIRRNLPLG